jgi:hypothetical protein
MGQEVLCVDVQYDKQTEQRVDQMVMRVSQELAKAGRHAMTMKSADIGMDRIYFYGNKEEAKEELWYLELAENYHASPVHGWKITMMSSGPQPMQLPATAVGPPGQVDKP